MLYAYVRLFRAGVLMRAVVDNRVIVTLTGVEPSSITRQAWIIGTTFAAISGVLLAPTLGLDATLLTFLILQSLGAAAIGRFSSLPGTYGWADRRARHIARHEVPDVALLERTSSCDAAGCTRCRPAGGPPRSLPAPDRRNARVGGTYGLESTRRSSRLSIAAC